MAEFERIEKVSYLRIFTHNINKRKFMISCCVFRALALHQIESRRANTGNVRFEIFLPW